MGRPKREVNTKKKMPPAATINETYLVEDQVANAIEDDAASEGGPATPEPKSFLNEEDELLSSWEEEKNEENNIMSKLHLHDAPSDEEESDEVLSPPPKQTTNRDVKRRRGPGKEPGKASLTRAMKAKRKSPLGASKGTPQRKAAKSSQKKQLILTNVLEGLALLDERRGVSMNALKRFLIPNATSKGSWDKLRPLVKEALESGIQDSLITRPKGHENKIGLTGNFKVTRKYKTSASKQPEEKVPQKAASKQTTKNVEEKAAIKLNEKEGKKVKKNSREEGEERQRAKPKRKLKRSISSTDLAKKVPLPKTSLKKSVSLEQLAPPTSKKVKANSKTKKKV